MAKPTVGMAKIILNNRVSTLDIEPRKLSNNTIINMLKSSQHVNRQQSVISNKFILSNKLLLENGSPKVTYGSPKVTYGSPKVTYGSPLLHSVNNQHINQKPPLTFIMNKYNDTRYIRHYMIDKWNSIYSTKIYVLLGIIIFLISDNPVIMTVVTIGCVYMIIKEYMPWLFMYFRSMNSIILIDDPYLMMLKLLTTHVRHIDIEYAILHYKKNVLNQLLKNALDLDINSLIIFCAKNNRYEIIPYLLNNGVDYYSKTRNNDDSLLHQLFFLRDTKLLDLLVKCDVNLNMTNRVGDNILGELLSRHTMVDMDLIDLCIKYGVDPFHKNDYGSTPLDSIYDRDLQTKIIFSYKKHLYDKISDNLIMIPHELIQIVISYLKIPDKNTSTISISYFNPSSSL